MKYLSIFLVFTCLGCNPQKSHNELILSSGTIERYENFTSVFVSARNIDVWLPDNYSNDNKYAVLYMHDGQMLYDSTSSWNHQEWGVDETVSELIDQNKIRNTLVVGIWNTELRHLEYFPQNPFERLSTEVQKSFLGSREISAENVLSDNYLEFLVHELKPFIDNQYSTFPDKKNTFVAGSSMGGLISMYAICEYPNTFGGAACLSTHWLGSFDTLNNPIPQKLAEYLDANLPSPDDHKIYFDFGTETLDGLYEPYQNIVDSVMIFNHYIDKNWKTLKFVGDDHSERSWNNRLSIPLRFLLKYGE